MKKCVTIEDGVRSALATYQVEPKVQWTLIPAGEGDYTDTLVLDGVKYPLFWWRCDPQVGSMFSKAPSRKCLHPRQNSS